MLTSFFISLPLTNPILIFSIILFIILFSPIILGKFKIPHIIGLIIAGAIVGPKGFNLLLRDSSIILFGTVGLLYLMFLAGLEIDITDFKKNAKKSLTFGLYTFSIPMLLGILIGVYVLHFSAITSILLASIFSSHTLIAYPIVSKFGVLKNRAVNIAIGGTIITDTMALLVLAIVTGLQTNETNSIFWIKLFISIIFFGLIIFFILPIIARWFFKNYADNVLQYIFVIGIVFLSGYLAELAGIEAIIGAFLSGLVLSKLIPNISPLRNRIEFVGNALFIPFFLIGVGMLIDFSAFIKDIETIKVAITITLTAICAKYFAAWLTQKTFKMSVDERRLIFGLSNAHAVVALAVVLVGYNIIIGYTNTGAPIRLFNESILNGTILLILVSCTIASFAAQKGAYNILMSNTPDKRDKDELHKENILIPINNPETIEELMQFGIITKTNKDINELHVLNVIDHSTKENNAYSNAKKMLHRASVIASATDNKVIELLRYDINFVNSISNVIKEYNITDLILGLHDKKGITDTFLGSLTEGILSKCNTTTFIYKSIQPIATIKRHLIIVPEGADKEIGFTYWVLKIWNIAKNTTASVIFYAPDTVLSYLKIIHDKYPIKAEFHVFNNWNYVALIHQSIKKDDSIIVVLSRENYPSYSFNMRKIPNALNKYFCFYNFILIYPMQAGISGIENLSLLESMQININKVDEFTKNIAKIFGGKQ